MPFTETETPQRRRGVGGRGAVEGAEGGGGTVEEEVEEFRLTKVEL